MSINCFFLKIRIVYVCPDSLVLQVWEAPTFQTLISAAPVYKERQSGPRENRRVHEWIDLFVSSAVSLAHCVKQHF